MTAGFFPSKMITTENIVKKKPKVKIASKRIEVNPEAGSSEFLKTEIMNNKQGRDVPASKNKKSETNKSQKSEIPSSDERKLYAAGKLKVKSSAMGTKKRGLEVVEECRKGKRRKMGRSATQQCDKVLRELNRGRTIVESSCTSRGSANSIRKVAQNGDKASSVRVGLLPKMLTSDKEEQKLWNWGRANAGQTSAKEEQKLWNWGRANVGQRRMSAKEKQRLREQILEVSRGKIPPHLQGLLKKLGFNRLREEKIELDIDAFSEESLMELKGIIRGFIGARAAKTANGVQQSERKMNHKRGAGRGHRSPSGSAANVNTPLNLVTSKCGSCGSIRCQCGLQRDYARLSSSERSLGQAHLDTSRKDYDGKIRSSSQMSKSDLDSDGSARALAQEHICSLNEPASGEDSTPLVDVQLSPKMALRAAMLRSRYAKIILKANTFLAHGDKVDLTLLQKEKESLKRPQREEKFKTEAAQTRAAEAASRTELKKQREQERKAARLALEQMERTVEIDDNLVSLKDLNDTLRGSWSDTDPAVVLGPIGGNHVGNVLQQLGLFLKDDSMGDEVILNEADLVLLQKEQESLKRQQQREEKFKTEAAQTRAAEAASRTELKKQREQERKAARLALEQMERTVEIGDNHVSLKDLNDMLMGSWSDTDPAVVLGPIGGIHVEKFKTEVAQTRAAEAASRTELKKQREQERKAARLVLEQMERTVEIDDNLVSLKDLSDMLRGSWSDTDPAVVLGPIGGIHVGNVLQRLGLFLKDDSMGDEVILNGDIEEGEIIS